MIKTFIRLVVLLGGIVLSFVVLMPLLPSKEQRGQGKVAEKPFVVVIPSYNNTKYCEQNLLSVLGQEYGNFRVIYADDASTDDTWDKVNALVERSLMKEKVTLIRRESNFGSVRNLYEMIQMCQQDEIVVRVDGDDFLAHPFVLKKLNKVYADPEVWMTYGNYLDYPSYVQKPKLCEPIPSYVKRRRLFRQYKWVSTHLQTFYASLGKKISRDDLMKEGIYLPMAGDVALIIPLLEMAGEHVRYIDEVLYLYNRINPISDHKKNLGSSQSARDMSARCPFILLLWSAEQ